MSISEPLSPTVEPSQVGEKWRRRDTVCWLVVAALMGGILYLVGLGSHIAILRLESYLVFHSLAELSSIAVVWGVFLLVWSSRRIVRNDALVFLGTAFLFVGLLDLFHMLAYKGMHVFSGPGESNRATQLWMAARAMESLSLLAFPALFGRRVWSVAVLGIFAVATSLLLASIFVWESFPVCYVDGAGLTAFKKIGEYAICAVLIGSLMLLRLRRGSLDTQVYRFMVSAIVISIASELAFTLYVSVFGLPNLFGHVAKIASHILICLALIRSGLSRPYSILFRELSEKEAALAEENRIRNVLLNALPYPTMLIRRDRTIVLANQVAQDVGAVAGGVCWDAFGHRDYIPPEDQEYIRRHQCPPPDGTCCTFCQADNAMDAQQVSEDPEVHAFGRIWDTFWIPVDDEMYLHYAMDVTDYIGARELLHLNESRLQALVRLGEIDCSQPKLVADFVLEQAVNLTDSELGFLGFLTEDEQVMTIHAWSDSAMAECAVHVKPMSFRIAESGIWGDAVRNRRPIIINDYKGLETGKRGLPEGHVPIDRYLGIPVFDGDRIVSVISVANKAREYDEGDVRQLTLLMNGMWRQLQRNKDAEEIRRALAEKDALLREVHHRVKNNLQVVVSLLRLQARRIDAPDAVEVFRECESRVKAMALVHETLYRSKEFASVDASRYVLRLCDDLKRTHGGSQHQITLTVHTQEIRLPMEQAVPIGLIISELVSNAFKHAFPDDRQGEVVVELRNGEAAEVELIISDDGVGIPSEIDPAGAGTVGLSLVTETVCGQLGGSIEIERSNGVRFEIRFKAESVQRETGI